MYTIHTFSTLLCRRCACSVVIISKWTCLTEQLVQRNDGLLAESHITALLSFGGESQAGSTEEDRVAASTMAAVAGAG